MTFDGKAKQKKLMKKHKCGMIRGNEQLLELFFLIQPKASSLL